MVVNPKDNASSAENPAAEDESGSQDELRESDDMDQQQGITGVGDSSVADSSVLNSIESNGDSEPMTASLMTRLFGVPLLIVSMIVGSAMLVVLLFGDIVSTKTRSIDSLLLALETSSGEKVAGAILLPRDKELWQMARELALRLEDKEQELGPGQLDEVVTRLSALMERDLSRSASLSKIGRQRLHFFMAALSRTMDVRAVPLLVRALDDPVGATRREALMALAEMSSLPTVHESLGQIRLSLSDEDPVVRMVACWVMSMLARPEDEAVIDQLKLACAAEEREVQWNAALTLARLGNSHGKGILLDLLDREYWEEKVQVQLTTGDGRLVQNPMPPQAVEEYLIAAVQAAANLQDAGLWETIAGLEQDRSPRVRAEAKRALKKRAESADRSTRAGR